MNNFIKKLNTIEEACVAFSLIGIVFLTFIETVLRYIVSYTFPWFGEVANYTIILLTYLGASMGVKYGTHFSMEALTEYCPDKISHLLKTAAYIISAAMAVFFVYYGFKHILTLKSFQAKTPAMQIPMFIPYIPIPLFSITMAFRFFVLSYRHFKAFLMDKPFERIRKK